jgi:hypothetical protein
MKKLILNSDLETPRYTWAAFTYIGTETTYITKLFRHVNLKIAYTRNNSVEISLKPRVQTTNKYLVSGVYKLTFPDCGMAYVGQRDRFLKKSYKEHQLAFKSNSNYLCSYFSQFLNAFLCHIISQNSETSSFFPSIIEFHTTLL